MSAVNTLFDTFITKIKIALAAGAAIDVLAGDRTVAAVAIVLKCSAHLLRGRWCSFVLITSSLLLRGSWCSFTVVFKRSIAINVVAVQIVERISAVSTTKGTFLANIIVALTAGAAIVI